MEETDARGYTKPKSLEFFFNGIIGHLRDRWGNTLENDRLCSQLANYWRHWFGAPTIGPVFEEYPVQGEHSEQEQPVTSVPPTEVTADESAGQIPVQILQVAAFLQAFLDLASEGNAALIEEIQIRRTRPGTLRFLRTEAMDPQVLSNLFVDFGIMAERLAQQHAANHPIENVEDDSP